MDHPWSGMKSIRLRTIKDDFFCSLKTNLSYQACVSDDCFFHSFKMRIICTISFSEEEGMICGVYLFDICRACVNK